MDYLAQSAAPSQDGHVIYDFGMNNGDNVEYYLLKAPLVVGVEANPELCAAVEKRFRSEIAEGRVVILNVALAERESAELSTFYVHQHNHVLSQLPEPPPDSIGQFTAIRIACRTPASIVAEFGEPLYVKIDVEHYDFEVLQNLFSAGVFPPEISAESHTVRVFAALVANGYKSFSLVQGERVARDYGEATITTADGLRPFRFKPHSAGPFGEDIRSPWEDSDTFFYTLAIDGLGWKDIHASRVYRSVAPASNLTIARRQAAGLLRKTVAAIKGRTLGLVRPASQIVRKVKARASF